MRTFISIGRNKGLSKIDNATLLVGGYRWTNQVAYIELPLVKGADHSNCYCLYVIKKSSTESLLVCYVPELGQFEQACRNETDIDELLSSCPTLNKIVQASKDKEYNSCFLLKVKDFSHKGLSTKHLCVATILKTPFDEQKLFNTSNKELYDKISLLVNTASAFMAEEKNVRDGVSKAEKEAFNKKRIRKVIRIAIIAIIGFDLLDVLDNNIEAADIDDDVCGFDDNLYDGLNDSVDYDQIDSPDINDDIDDIDDDINDADSCSQDINYDDINDGDGQTDDNLEDGCTHSKGRDISFTGYLNCTRCSCGGYVPGNSNYCSACHHSFFDHRRPGD